MAGPSTAARLLAPIAVVAAGLLVAPLLSSTGIKRARGRCGAAAVPAPEGGREPTA